MSEKHTTDAAQDARMQEADAWATEALAAMLERVRAVCITEYQWLIDELGGAK